MSDAVTDAQIDEMVFISSLSGRSRLSPARLEPDLCRKSLQTLTE